MRPYILNSVDFSEKKMILYTETDEGRFSFPVLPAKKEQKDCYITKYEDGRYVIRTHDYDKLRKGEFEDADIIKLAHEVSHYDRRVIVPAYFLGYQIDKSLDVKIRRYIYGMGFDSLLRLPNTVEDYLSMFVLNELGFSKKEIDGALGFDRDTLKRLNIAKKLVNVKFVGSSPFSEVELDDFVPSKILSKSFIKKPWNERIKILYYIYYLIDVIVSKIDFLIKTKSTDGVSDLILLFNSLASGDLKAIFSPHRCLLLLNCFVEKNAIKEIKEKINRSRDPFWKLRWWLELWRLTKFDDVSTGLNTGLKFFKEEKWMISE